MLKYIKIFVVLYTKYVLQSKHPKLQNILIVIRNLGRNES